MKDVLDGFGAGAAAALVGCLLLALGHGCRSENSWHDKAVKSGKAEYYLDENNNKQWRWK
jgi:hypothetical protein